MLNPGLVQYVESEIIPRYASFDKAHREDHVRKVIEEAMNMSVHYDVDKDVLYAAAAFHDTGLVDGREVHHMSSGRIIREDPHLKEWFTPDKIETIAQAAEDHRASSGCEPRSIYGKIVSEADRDIEPMRILRRTVQFGMDTIRSWTRKAIGNECWSISQRSMTTEVISNCIFPNPAMPSVFRH